MQIRFEVTNRCNARCIMCPREKMTRPQGIMDINLYKRVLEESIELGITQVQLANFGEPFIDPFIFERAEYAKSKHLKVSTNTNASRLDKEACKKVLIFFDNIRISMYANTKETFEKIEKGLKFEQVTSNIDRLINLRKEVPNNLTIEIFASLIPENEKEWRSIARHYCNIVDRVSIWKPTNWVDGRQYNEVSKEKLSCGRPSNGPIHVQWDGIVTPCCLDYDNKIILGDLKTQTLEEVYYGDKYNKLREVHEKGEFSKFPFCDMCNLLNKKEDAIIYSSVKLPYHLQVRRWV